MPKDAERVKRSLGRIQAWLGSNNPSIHKTLMPPAPREHVEAVERKLGQPLPPGLVAFWETTGGQDQEIVGELFEEEEAWLGALAQPLKHQPAYYLFETQYVAESLPLKAEDSRMPGHPPRCVEIANNTGGDVLLIDCADPGADTFGRVLCLYHEYGAAYVAAPSLGAYLETVADGLESGRIVYDPDEGLNDPAAPDLEDDDIYSTLIWEHEDD